MADNAFGVYVFHAPILIAVSLLFKDWEVYPFLKFIIVSAAVLVVSFISSYLIRKIRWMKKVFS